MVQSMLNIYHFWLKNILIIIHKLIINKKNANVRLPLQVKIS